MMPFDVVVIINLSDNIDILFGYMSFLRPMDIAVVKLVSSIVKARSVGVTVSHRAFHTGDLGSTPQSGYNRASLVALEYIWIGLMLQVSQFGPER